MSDDFLKKLSIFTVLYLEDDDGIRENITEILKFYFRSVYVANNTDDGFNLYLKYSPDLIITDIKMDKEIGIDFIKKIRQTDTKTKVIITSAYTNTDYLLSATELNLIKYIVKPITDESLEEAFKIFVKSYEDNRLYFLAKNSYFDQSRSIVKIENEEFILTKKESIFLKLLISKNRIITYEELQNSICDENSIMSQNAVRLFIKNLRKKLPKDFLKNIQGIGYYCDIKS